MYFAPLHKENEYIRRVHSIVHTTYNTVGPNPVSEVGKGESMSTEVLCLFSFKNAILRPKPPSVLHKHHIKQISSPPASFLLSSQLSALTSLPFCLFPHSTLEHLSTSTFPPPKHRQLPLSLYTKVPIG
jgi:hypothetical protein